MSFAPLQHPGANAACPICHGLGLHVVRDGERARATACTCVGTCPRCNGTGFSVATSTARRPPRTRCDCARVLARGLAFDSANLPARHADSTLANFDAKHPKVKPGYLAAQSWLTNVVPGQEQRGLVLYGDVGRGKTHLLCALLRQLALTQGLTVRFVEFSHLLADLKSGFDQGRGTAALIDPLVQVDILGIDELGKGRNTEFEGTVLDELVSRRYNAARPIIGTTNYTPRPSTGRPVANLASASIAGATTDHLPTLADRVGDRVYSRLQEMCDFVPLGGDDWRAVGRGRNPSRRG